MKHVVLICINLSCTLLWIYYEFILVLSLDMENNFIILYINSNLAICKFYCVFVTGL